MPEPGTPPWRRDPNKSAQDNAESLLGAVVARLGAPEARPSQVRMARAVAGVFDDAPARISVKAGTGVGKSCAYLCPAAASGLRIAVVVTSIALQDQLAQKDLPLINEVLGGELSFAVVKGRSRYLCPAKLDDARKAVGRSNQTAMFDGALDGDKDDHETHPVSDDALDEISAVLDWADTTTTGDLSDYQLELSPEAARAVTTTAAECPGASTCSFGEVCFSEQARVKGREANIVVANTALFGADVSVDGALLAGRDAVVIDEAHDAEDSLAQALSAELSSRQLSSFATTCSRFVSKAAAGEDGPGRRLHAAVGFIRNAASELDQALAPHDQKLLKSLDEHPKIEQAVNNAYAAVMGASTALTTLRNGMATQSPPAIARFERALAAAKTITTQIEDIQGRAESEAFDAIWVEGDGTCLRRAPVHLGGLLHRVAWENRSVVFTSATLTTTMPVRLGFLPSDPFLDVGSPYDYREQSMLYIPTLPGVNEPSWFDAAWHEMEAMIRAAEGRTLALFTSNKDVARFAAKARETLPWTVLAQGDAPKGLLTQKFRDDEHACLFATSSFFTGVDVQGSSLSLVIISRVPFPRPDEPLWQARRNAAGDEWTMAESPKGSRVSLKKSFAEVDIPRAASQMAQAAGRLVRSSSCRGVVMVLDSRLAEKAYRPLILEELPDMVRTRDIRRAATFVAWAVGRLPSPIPQAS